ncbi:conserved hypothetical protein [metagenome]|uniref:Acyl dehydratase n=1 Tax=metagenome TaxID=256318 RepID=A0A2P2C8Y9_9ZZZZ
MKSTTQDSPRPTFEELEVGLVLPGLRRGPLTTAHLMRWSAAIENWHRIHYDHPYSTEVEHLPGLLVSGNWKQQLITETVAGWLQPEGWLAGISFEFRKMNRQGDLVTAWAEITALREWQGFGVVELAVGMLDQDGQESTPGKAVGVVPLAGGSEVPYPFDLSPELPA